MASPPSGTWGSPLDTPRPATSISTRSPVPPIALPKRSATASSSWGVLAACASWYSRTQAWATRVSSSTPTASASRSVNIATKALVKTGSGASHAAK